MSLYYFSLSRQQRHRRHTMKHHVEEDSRGPASAQKHLRDLAHSLPPSATNPRLGEEREQGLLPMEVSGGEEGGLLEFQDATDYGNR
jgi:plasmid stabilization system protein ParE